jgi:chemotaxis regulatin CheY-phosphate phosphatase CheZ
MSDRIPRRNTIQQEVAELAAAISDIVRQFKDLQNPLRESSEKVPLATEQLDKISEQTEAVTHQMLDRVEKIVAQLESSKQDLEDIKTCIDENRPDDVTPLADGLIEKADVTCNEVYLIMDALQFQDIAAQQMNHAGTLLEDIEAKLQNIIGAIANRHDSQPVVSSADKKSGRVYDPHADLFDKKTDQATIDDLFAGKG